jgi:tRNA-splicing ligase RtcB
MDISRLEQIDATSWEIPRHGPMNVPARIYATEELLRDMDDKVYEQIVNVTTLPGIVRAAYAMPDAHWGYGFPIGGVAAFDADEGGVVSAGGVGFDISCGVRTHLTGLSKDQIIGQQAEIADALYATIPVGVGSKGRLTLDDDEMTAMLLGGARWALERGYGSDNDLDRIEEKGTMSGADPAVVSSDARRRQRREMGTLGSGNHYLEVQEVAEIFDGTIASAYGLRLGECVVTIHCGSRGLGHQIGTEFLREMVLAAATFGIELPDRELACAPVNSELGQRYLGAMRAGINCALANRQIIGHLMRQVFSDFFPDASLPLLYDVSHNTCKVERHDVADEARSLFVHRKGATRALGPGHPDLPEALRPSGQPVLIGGSMGTQSHVLAGLPTSEERALSSACHGAGRKMSRHKATRMWKGRQVIDELAQRGITVKSPSARGVAEEAPGAYKDVAEVVRVAERAGLAKRVARLTPVICIKG